VLPILSFIEELHAVSIKGVISYFPVDFWCSLNAEAPNLSFKRKDKTVMSFMVPVTTDLDLEI
jgi:hypothetical protein